MTFVCDNCNRAVDKVNAEGLCPKCAREEEKNERVGKNTKRVRVTGVDKKP